MEILFDVVKDKSSLIKILKNANTDVLMREGFWLFAEFFDKEPAYFEFGEDTPWDPTYLVYYNEDDEVIAIHAFRNKDQYIDGYVHLMGLQVLDKYKGKHLSYYIMKDTMDYCNKIYPENKGFTLQTHEPSLENLYTRKEMGFKMVPGMGNLMVKYN